jgi:BirA family biotin operon repressor/biotin-[acetyl-CoA-carboxylase] ligase
LSLAELAGAHPLWAADVARFAPWDEAVLGPQAGPAAGTWLVARSDAGGPGRPILVVGECDSSLDVGWVLAEAGLLPPFASVLALSQRRGRGQMRRDWRSPPGNLHAALAWPGHEGDLGAMAPVLVGHCLAEGLAALGFPAQVKWPNDLLLRGEKVGGILLEERGGRVLAGIGLNCASAPEATLLRRDHAAPATALAAHGAVPGALALWAGLVQRAQTCYRQCVTVSDSGERSQLVARRMAWLGRDVLVRENESTAYRARIIGLAGDGGLRLHRTDGGPGLELTLHCGSISLL